MSKADPLYVDPADPKLREIEFTPAQQETLETINQRIAGAADVEGIIDFLFEQTQSLSPADRISLAFVAEGGGRVAAHHVRASYERIYLKHSYAEDLEGSSLKPIIDSGQIRIINDLEAYAAAHPASISSKLLLREGIRSSLTCPLCVDGRNVGLLFRSACEPNAYRFEDAAWHMAVAERIAQAAEKTYRIEELTRARNAYTEMLAFVTHELKSPLTSLMMSVDVLEQGYLGDINEKQHEKLNAISAQAEYLLSLIGDYLNLARAESGDLQTEMRGGVDLAAEVLQPAMDLFKMQLSQSSERFNADIEAQLPKLECDPNLLRIVINNLLGNAIKYGNDDGRIDFIARRDGDGIVVSVRNEGPGFPESQRDRLFRRFSRLDTPELKRRKGTGVGLYTSWKIVQAHHGRMDARSEEGKWAEFSFRLPTAQPAE